MSYRLPVWLALAAAMAAPLPSAERNGWPVMVAQTDTAGSVESWQAGGPLFFAQNGPSAREVRGARPFYLHAQEGDREAAYFLYPLLTWRRQGDDSRFSFFNLINGTRDHEAATGAVTRGFDVWPFYFSRDTSAADTSYRAFFPLSGTIKYRFGLDALAWHAFPFYARADKNGRHTTYAPWPFVRVIDGAGHHGFEFWPLFGRRGREGDYRNQFYLWPLFYQQESNLSAAQLDVKVGALPFYAREQGPGYLSETYLWPFFGYTRRAEPARYDETRYFWPFSVQGRGDGRAINRWAPFYTHSMVRGYDKTWVLWPLFRVAQWQEGGLAQKKCQLLYFLYWSQEQRSLAHPAAAPACKTHLWPLLSVWDNGAGRRQLQFPSPLEVFSPTNEVVRQLYSPLFALYRYDRRAPGDVRWSLLWDGITWQRTPAAQEFHLGPLLGVQTSHAEQRVTLGNGLLGMTRRPGERAWRLFLFDFPSKTVTKVSTAPSP